MDLHANTWVQLRKTQLLFQIQTQRSWPRLLAASAFSLSSAYTKMCEQVTVVSVMSKYQLTQASLSFYAGDGREGEIVLKGESHDLDDVALYERENQIALSVLVCVLISECLFYTFFFCFICRLQLSYWLDSVGSRLLRVYLLLQSVRHLCSCFRGLCKLRYTYVSLVLWMPTQMTGVLMFILGLHVGRWR